MLIHEYFFWNPNSKERSMYTCNPRYSFAVIVRPGLCTFLTDICLSLAVLDP